MTWYTNYMKHTWDIGESIAERYLKEKGYVILEKNFRFGRFWEIDIIAKKGEHYHFIEVKYRQNDRYGAPEESITPWKLRKCFKTMQFYCAKHKISEEQIQFDVIALLRNGNWHRVTHYRNIEI